ncbi:hypothetical protein LAZ67_17002845 [Cordylochernes scorpioides]|uniref:Uncharacterized protein n=1 Tax=Cordylochernes scorpioides TaxID=51811 RepID=A0ABY6LGV7_9ARAC|nr:hypothetical protein LAZ67_17002845 [Cordylochernes scorpioides]
MEFLYSKQHRTQQQPPGSYTDSPQEGSIDGVPILQAAQNPTTASRVLYRFTTGRKHRWSSYTPSSTEPNNSLQEQTPCAAAPNMEYRHCSSCIPGLGALTGYYQPGQLSPGFLSRETHNGTGEQDLIKEQRNSRWHWRTGPNQREENRETHDDTGEQDLIKEQRNSRWHWRTGPAQRAEKLTVALENRT